MNLTKQILTAAIFTIYMATMVTSIAHAKGKLPAPDPVPCPIWTQAELDLIFVISDSANTTDLDDQYGPVSRRKDENLYDAEYGYEQIDLQSDNPYLFGLGYTRVVGEGAGKYIINARAEVEKSGGKRSVSYVLNIVQHKDDAAIIPYSIEILKDTNRHEIITKDQYNTCHDDILAHDP